MILLFSDLYGYEDKTLYVIGNGFDVFHNIPSRYSNFYHWLKSKGEDEFVSKMEEFFPAIVDGEYLLWKDFEKALGEYDLNKIFDDATKGLDKRLDERVKYAAHNQLEPVTSQIKPMIQKWIRQIDLSRIVPKLDLPKESWYLTFNYTLTLEDVYEIAPDRICHIHDSINDSKIIVGHNNLVNIDNIGDNNYEWYEEASKKDIARIMNDFVKNPYEIKRNHELFFDRIRGLKRIVVLGHSVSDIDEAYYGYIRGAAIQDAHWHFSKHSPSDEERIAACLENRQIDDKNRWIFYF